MKVEQSEVECRIERFKAAGIPMSEVSK